MMKEYNYLLFVKVRRYHDIDFGDYMLPPTFSDFFGDNATYKLIPYLFHSFDNAIKFYKEEYKYNEEARIFPDEIYGAKKDEMIEMKRYFDQTKVGKFVEVAILEIEVK